MHKPNRLPEPDQQTLLNECQVRLVEPKEMRGFNRLLDQHHYLKSIRPVGQRLCNVATDRQGQWLALLGFSAAAQHLKHRDRWIGWSPQQRSRCLRCWAAALKT